MNSIVLTVEAVEAAEVKEKFASFSGKFKFGYGDNVKEDYIAVIGFNGNIERFKAVESGEHFIITGSLTSEDYQTEGGAKRKRFKLIANDIQCCDPALQINHISIAGGVGQDPDLKTFDTGKMVVSTSVAVRETKEKTNWFNIKAWGKTAEIIADYVRKGSQFGCVGELQIEHWGQSDDNFKFVVNANQISLLGKNNSQPSNPTDDDDF